MYRAILLLLVPSLVTGCYSTRSIPYRSLDSMHEGNHARELVVRDPNGHRIRVGPRSQLRFLRTDGLWTAWIRGGDLRVNAQGAFHRGRASEPKLVGLQWSQVNGVEVKDLNGAKTYGVIVGTTVLVAAVLVLILGSAKGGGGGGGLGKLGSGLGRGGRGLARGGRGLARGGRGLARGGRGLARGVGPLSRNIAVAMARGSYTVARAWAHGWHWYGPAIYVDLEEPLDEHSQQGPHPEEVAAVEPPQLQDPAGTPPPPPPPPPAPPSSAADEPPPQPSPALAPTGPLQVDRQSTAPLFSHLVTRRASLKLVVAVEGGGELHHAEGGAFSGYLGLRISDVLELGGGARMFNHRGTETLRPQEMRTSWMGFFRLLLHFDVDPARRVGLPIGMDIGAGHPRMFLRFILGLRVRIVDQLSVGLYPFNITYTQFADNDLKQKVGWWSFPTTAELLFAF